MAYPIRIAKQLEKLARYVDQVPQKMNSFSSEELHFRYAPGKWSKKEIIGHLIDSGVYNWQRFMNIQHAPQPFEIQGYAQSELVSANDYHNKPLSHLMELWSQINRQIVFTTQSLSEEALQLKIAGTPWSSYFEGDGDLAWLINDYVAHMEHHLIQLFGSLDVLNSHADFRLSVEEAQQKLEEQSAQRFITLLQHGTMSAEWYAPDKVDLQKPHEQDELYVVASGSGIFYNNGNRQAFKTGDMLFVPAGVEHRFEEFTEDFRTWVIFYGPKGGETPILPSEYQQQFDNETFTISTDQNRLDPVAIHRFLSTSYWAKDRSLASVTQSLSFSYCFGLYHHTQQIGLSRVITDFTGFAYLCDVYVLEEFRGKGLGKWMIKTVMEHPQLKGIKTWTLFTETAQALYQKYGFEGLSNPEIFMRKQIQNKI